MTAIRIVWPVAASGRTETFALRCGSADCPQASWPDPMANEGLLGGSHATVKITLPAVASPAEGGLVHVVSLLC